VGLKSLKKEAKIDWFLEALDDVKMDIIPGDLQTSVHRVEKEYDI